MQQIRIQTVPIMKHPCHRWHAARYGGASRSWVRPTIRTSEKDLHPRESLRPQNAVGKFPTNHCRQAILMESDIRTKPRNGHGMLTKTNCLFFVFCLTASTIQESNGSPCKRLADLQPIQDSEMLPYSWHCAPFKTSRMILHVISRFALLRA